MLYLSVRKTLWIFVAAVVIPPVVRADDPVTRAAQLLNELHIYVSIPSFRMRTACVPARRCPG